MEKHCDHLSLQIEIQRTGPFLPPANSRSHLQLELGLAPYIA